MEDYFHVLEECPLFKGLPLEELKELLLSSRGRLRSFVKGETLASAGEKVHYLNIMIEGSVKGEMTDAGGKVIKIEDILPPQALAVAFMYGKQNHYPVNIVADTDTLIFSIPSDAFLELMQTNNLVLERFVSAVSNRAQFLSQKIKYLSFTTIKGKLVQYMLELALIAKSDLITLPMSQSMLSELFGVARPSVGRAVVELKEAGLIDTHGRQVRLLDRSGMSALLK